MNKKGIYIFLIALAVIITAVIVADFTGNKPGKRASNPFEYDMASLKAVDPELIIYRETKNFRLSIAEPGGIACHNDLIYVVGDNKLQVITTEGRLMNDLALPVKPVSLDVDNDHIYIVGEKTLLVYDHNGNLVLTVDEFHDNTMLSSIAVYEDMIFIADAGRRRVYRYNQEGEKELEIDGRASADAIHGFIVPSGCFEVAINEFGDLWIANPGMHALENYTFSGIRRGYWTSTFSDVKGFSGCCNPSHFTFLPGGNFITSEKGIIRIKEYKPSGEFVGVVAAPEKFIEEGKVPSVATDSIGRVYACDPDKNSIRVFEKI